MEIDWGDPKFAFNCSEEELSRHGQEQLNRTRGWWGWGCFWDMAGTATEVAVRAEKAGELLQFLMSKFSISGSGEQSVFVFVWSAVPSGSDSMALAGWAKPSTAYTTPSPPPSAFLSSPAGSALTQSTLVLFLGALFSSRTHHFHLVSPQAPASCLQGFPLPPLFARITCWSLWLKYLPISWKRSWWYGHLGSIRGLCWRKSKGWQIDESLPVMLKNEDANLLAIMTILLLFWNFPDPLLLFFLGTYYFNCLEKDISLLPSLSILNISLIFILLLFYFYISFLGENEIRVMFNSLQPCGL